MFVEALFITVNWESAKLVNKFWRVQIMEYYMVIKKDILDPYLYCDGPLPPPSS